MPKRYSSKEQLQKQILQGAEKLASIVATTLGPRGQNVIIHNKGQNPFITKDGVTVANFIDFDEDPFENAIAQIIKQAATQTNSDAGDGTTTATILAWSILKQAQSYLVAGIPPVELKKGMEKAVKEVIEDLKANSVAIQTEKDIKHIATISANGDESIGSLIAMAVDKIGKDGAITIEEARSLETSLNVIEGFRIDSGYVSNEFITNERLALSKHDDPFILVTDLRIEVVEQLVPILELVAREKRSFVIIADEVVENALAACIYNAIMAKDPKTPGGMKINIIKAPKYGQERINILKDLALSVGANFITRERGMKLEDVKLPDLGRAKFVESYKNGSIFVGGKGNYKLIEERIESLKSEIKHTDDLNECERIQERITRLSSGVAVIGVGGKTEVEMIEKKHRIEDALEAVRSAQEEGMLPGGGAALFKASQEIEDNFEREKKEEKNKYEKLGFQIICQAIKEPFRYILKNAGFKVDVLENIMETKYKQNFDIGYDVVQEKFVEMYDEGIVDPAKVTRCALENAMSVAGTLIMTKSGIVEK